MAKQKGTTVTSLLVLGVPVGTADPGGREDDYGGTQRDYPALVLHQAQVGPADCTRVQIQSEDCSKGNNGPWDSGLYTEEAYG